MKKSTSLLLGIGFAGVVVVAVAVASYYWIPSVYGNPTDAASFGDMFGATSALFSGLAFVAVVGTLLLQRLDLQLQRKELELTRDELRGQKEQLELQNENLVRQAKENKFFQLLSLHEQIINSIRISEEVKGDVGGGKKEIKLQVITSGRDCFPKFIGKILWLSSDTDNYKDRYNSFFWSGNKSKLSHYFRNIEEVLSFLFSDGETAKKNYLGIFKSQFSDAQLKLLFLHCASDMASDSLRVYVKHSGFIRDVDIDYLKEQTPKVYEQLKHFNENLYAE